MFFGGSTAMSNETKGRWRMRPLRSVIGAVTCLVLMSAPAVAQAPGFDLKLNPRIGLYQPLTNLADAPGAVAEMKGSLAIGLGAELQLGALPFGLRANLDYATSSEVQLSGGSVTTSESPNATLLALVGDLMFRPLPKLIIVQPYLFAGGGVKKYDVSTSDAVFADLKSASDPTVHLGGGLDLGLGPLALNAEVGDYISWSDFQGSLSGNSDTKTQHDLFLTVGLSIGML